MSEKTNNEYGLAPTGLNAFLMVIITVIIAALIAAMVAGVASIPYNVNINSSEKGHVVVYISNKTTNAPVSNALIGIYSYEQQLLLAGPLLSDDKGMVDFVISDNFDNHFRVRSIYNGITYTENVDKRSFFIQFDDIFGNFSTPFYAVIIAMIGAIFAYFNRARLKQYWEGFLELFKDNDEI
jgi:hypothetical protein